MPAPAHPTALLAHHRQSLILGALALLLFILGVQHQTPIGFDSRFVLFAKEMLRHGPAGYPFIGLQGAPWATSFQR